MKLKKTKRMISIIKIILITFLVLFNKVNANNLNKIIFTLNDKIYTTIDLKERRDYIKFKDNLDPLNIEDNINELSNINIYSEYYENTNNKINEKDIQKYYQVLINRYLEIKNNSLEELNKIISKNIILKNIKKDLQKKQIIQNLLDKKKSEIFQNDIQNLQTLYKYDIEMFSLKIKELTKLQNIVTNISFNEIEKKIIEIKKKNIIILYEDKNIKNINNLNKKILNAIKFNQKEFYFESNNTVFIGKIIKRLKGIKGLNLSIFQINSKIEFSNNDLLCDKITDIKSNSKNKVKEIRQNYLKLNDKLKENLNNIDDNITFVNQKDNEFIYFILCKIEYDIQKYKDIKIQDKIEYLVNEIDRDFIYLNSKRLRLKIKNE